MVTTDDSRARRHDWASGRDTAPESHPPKSCPSRHEEVHCSALALVPRSVITGEDHHRVLFDPEAPELGQENAGRPIDAGYRCSVHAVTRLPCESLLHIDRQMDVNMGQVEKERPVPIRSHEPHGLLNESGCQR